MGEKFFRKVARRRSHFAVTIPMPIVSELGIKHGDIVACATEGRRIVMEVLDTEPVLEGLAKPSRAADAIREMMKPDEDEEPKAARPAAGRPKVSKLERLRIK